MLNIIKSQNYQIRHDIFSVVVIIACMVLGIGTVITDGIDSVTGGAYIPSHGELVITIWALLIIIFSGRIVGWDYTDKTINYELLSGHSKETIFFGRLLSSIIWILAVCLLYLFVPMTISTLIGGWGNTSDLQNTMLRIGLAVFPLLRLSIEFYFVSVILRNCYATFAIGYVLLGAMLAVSILFSEILNIDPTYLMAYSTLDNLLNITNSHSETINGLDVEVFDTAISMKETLWTIASSFISSAIFLTASYTIFKKRDMQ